MSATAMSTTTCCGPTAGGDDDAHDALREQGAKIVHDITATLNSGSISAEHGLGAMKTAEALTLQGAPIEIEALRAIRGALGPPADHEPPDSVLAGLVSREARA
jgi:FAD/FMN-containing dehydrogenase